MDFDDLKSKVTKNTKAVILVHFAGLIHEKIFEIKSYLKNKNIILIEDSAHAHGAKIKNKYAGSIGDFGCFSFYSTKVITSGGEGGFISTNNKKYYNLCKSFKSIGINYNSKKESYNKFGSNNRMTEIQSIIALSQLNNIEIFLKHRNIIANSYKKFLKNLSLNNYITFQNHQSYIRHSFWRFIVIIKDSKIKRNRIKSYFLKYNISIDWPYEPLIHQQPAFKNKYNINKEHFSKSEYYCKQHFCLPMHYQIKIQDAKYISELLLNLFRK